MYGSSNLAFKKNDGPLAYGGGASEVGPYSERTVVRMITPLERFSGSHAAAADLVRERRDVPHGRDGAPLARERVKHGNGLRQEVVVVLCWCGLVGTFFSKELFQSCGGLKAKEGHHVRDCAPQSR